MNKRALVKELARLATREPTTEDWRDLYETIEAYNRRCLARAIARSPQRDEIVALIKALANGENHGCTT